MEPFIQTVLPSVVNGYQQVYDDDFPVQQYFLAKTGKPAHSVGGSYFNTTNLLALLEKEGATLIKHSFYNGKHQNSRYMFWDCLVSVDHCNISGGMIKTTDRSKVYVYSIDLEKAQTVYDGLLECKLQESEDRGFYLLVQTSMGMDLQEFPVPEINVDLDVGYGSDFRPIHEAIVEKITNKSSGLYIFHGPPGTGKTSYIKYLGKNIDKRMIFIPSNLVFYLDKPEFTTLLLGYSNSILVIEDAEKALQSREDMDTGVVPTILNLTDGILASILGIAVIVTYNYDRDQVDKALLRKGRLQIEHDFGLLSAKDANAMLKKLGKKFVTKDPMSLADIYNLEDQNFASPVPETNSEYSGGSDNARSIGFGTPNKK